MDLGPLVQKMEIVAVDVVDPAYCLLELFFLQTLPLGSLASARRSFRYVVVRHRQVHIRDELSGGIIRSHTKQLRGEVNHVAFLLASEADEILIDLHARRFIFMERTAHHALPADLMTVMLRDFAGADLFFYLGVDPQKHHLLSDRDMKKAPVFIGTSE